ncbi:unnamed protein product [Adineta ricciae]|nr:unnamed protein product [Adineta ricciae]
MLCACAVGVHSYSTGIHRIRVRIDNGNAFLGIRSRSIPPVPDDCAAGRYDSSPATYGWGNTFCIFNGTPREFQRNHMYRCGDVYVLELNCDEHRLTMINENTKEQDDMEVDVSSAPFPWCLFIHLPRTTAQVSLI